MSASDTETAATAAPGMKVYIETYGCQMNVADTELMFGNLIDRGYTVSPSLDEADIVLLNTCAVRENAESRIYGRASQLLRFKYTNPDLILGITGCMAEHLKTKIVDKAPYVDLVVGPDAYRRLPDLIEQARDNDPVIDVRLDKRETYEGMTPAREGGVSGWVSIQRGCDKFCTFCIVPYTRGRERATPPREVLRQAREMAQMGYREITLLGQTVNSYRFEDVDFADLLRSVAATPGLDRIRYTSPYPVDFTPKLIETLAELDNVPNYLHLPLQSGANSMLERMKRGYTVEDFMKIVHDLRTAMPDIALSTDIIVGFPDETNEEYEATMEIMREVEFDFAFMFAYSEREGTYASKRIPDTIPEALKKERLKAVIDQQNEISRQKFGARVGGKATVLAEGPSRRDPAVWFGKSEDFKTTLFPWRDGVTRGDLMDVRIDRATSHTLYGTLEDSVSHSVAAQ